MQEMHKIASFNHVAQGPLRFAVPANGFRLGI